jgi:succinate dehydrogenase / fumarate reductase cytochrome b subunit
MLGTGWRRVHSLSGVFPVAVFMLVQVAAHAKALDGPAAHRAAMEGLDSLPGLWVWRLLILLPLAFHATYGCYLALQPSYNVGRYPLSGNWMYVLQRASGLVALLFILLHGVTFSLPAARGVLPADGAYDLLGARLSSTAAAVPWWGLAYLLGLGCCSFHLACGIWTFCARWGVTVTRRSRTQLGAAMAVFGLAIFLASANVVLVLAAGAPLIGRPPVQTLPAASCAPDAPASAHSPSGGEVPE